MRDSHLGVAMQLLINWASICWAVKVLVRENALAYTAYAAVGKIVPENSIAWLVIGIVMTNLVAIGLRWFGLRIWSVDVIGYVTLLLGWSGIMYAVIFADPPQPTTFSTVSTMCMIAFLAVVLRAADEPRRQ